MKIRFISIFGLKFLLLGRASIIRLQVARFLCCFGALVSITGVVDAQNVAVEVNDKDVVEVQSEVSEGQPPTNSQDAADEAQRQDGTEVPLEVSENQAPTDVQDATGQVEKQDCAEVALKLAENEALVSSEFRSLLRCILELEEKEDSISWLSEILKALAYFAVTLIVACLVARFAYHRWRLKNLYDRWYSIVEFLHEHPHYMDEIKNRDYKTNYKTVDEQWQYESVARMCIAFVDDMFHLKHIKPDSWIYRLPFVKKPDDWLRGTVPLFVGRHQSWFNDNREPYDPAFVKFVEDKLPIRNESSENGDSNS